MIRLIKLVLLVLVLGAVYLAREPVAAVFSWAVSQVDDFRRDSKALVSGEYKDRVAREYKKAAEANREPLATVPDNPELQRELAEARQQMLDERAKALERKMDTIAHGDVASLKRQTVDNAKAAGGNY